MRKLITPFVILLSATALLYAQVAPAAASQATTPQAPPALAPPHAQAPADLQLRAGKPERHAGSSRAA